MNVPASRRRALLRDLARGLAQQMIFWGCDARHPQGNLLVAAGMQRLARLDRGGEGSSRYREAWGGGVIELHSFCVGWYSDEAAAGCLYVRASQRWLAPSGVEPIVPGHYDEDRLERISSDGLLTAVRPLVAWVENYESRIAALRGPLYRTSCWRRLREGKDARAWLPPGEAARAEPNRKSPIQNRK